MGIERHLSARGYKGIRDVTLHTQCEPSSYMYAMRELRYPGSAYDMGPIEAGRVKCCEMVLGIRVRGRRGSKEHQENLAYLGG